MNPMNNENVLSSAGNQTSAAANQPLPKDVQSVKQMALKDIQLIENLVQTGAMTQEQGQNLMNYVTKKAFEKYTLGQQNSHAPVNTMQQASPKLQNALSAPAVSEFFNKDGRLDVFDYLKNTNAEFDEDEISKISALVEKIENTAIERYLREKNHEKTLNSENEAAKQKLRAYAQNSASDGNKNLVFTREQIGKMSGAEFAKYERMIMDQLRKGLIK